MSRLDNKVILVTGSTKGIGLATAKLCAQEGAKLVIVGRLQKDCGAVARQIAEAGGEAIAVGCDIRDQNEINRLVDITNEAFGKVDVLVNNACWWGNKPFVELGREDFKSWFGDYVGSLYFLSQRVAKDQINGGRQGSIINVASTAAFYGERGMSTYCAAKAAVVNLTRAMALELGEYDIRVNCIAPGTTKRENETRSPEVMESFRRFSALSNLNTAEDVAPAIAFLASDDSRGMTGSVLVVDAGYSSIMMPEKLYQKQ